MRFGLSAERLSETNSARDLFCEELGTHLLSTFDFWRFMRVIGTDCDFEFE